MKAKSKSTEASRRLLREYFLNALSLAVLKEGTSQSLRPSTGTHPALVRRRLSA